MWIRDRFDDFRDSWIQFRESLEGSAQFSLTVSPTYRVARFGEPADLKHAIINQNIFSPLFCFFNLSLVNHRPGRFFGLPFQNRMELNKML